MAEVGVSDPNHYSDTFLKSLLIFQGAPSSVDFGSWMHLRYVGTSEKIIDRLLGNCRIATWILPKGAPFTMINFFTRRPLFSDDFRDQFASRYTLIQRGAYYDVWRCVRYSAKQ